MTDKTKRMKQARLRRLHWLKPMLLPMLLALMVTGCGTNSQRPTVVQHERLPNLPANAKQQPRESACTPSCLMRVQDWLKSMRERLTSVMSEDEAAKPPGQSK